MNNDFLVYSPPEYPDIIGKVSIFLGGSIEMGRAKEWQKEFVFLVKHKQYHFASCIDNLVILNPRRQDWDPYLKQDISEPAFNQQVNWELDYLERCTHRVFYFEEDTISPVTLLELGKFGNADNTYVSYHPKYLRKGNVQIFCHRYRIPVYPNIRSIIDKIFL